MTPAPDCLTISTDSAARLKTALLHCASAGLLTEFLNDLSPRALARLAADWPLFARPDQMPPQGDWTIWLMIGGRGAGKTRAGAEWVRGMALGIPPFAAAPCGRIALVGETFADVRDVMIEGVSGLLSLGGAGRPAWSPTRRRLEWPNGAIAQAFSAEDPQGLRGPQFAAAWCDELCKWRNAQETWDMLQFGLRLGAHPRQLVTTTPRPMPLLRSLMADPRAVLSRARTRDNAANLAPAFLQAVVGKYAGTRLGRQELDGEMVEERADALWSRGAIEAARVSGAPAFVRLVVAIDPPASSGKRADRCGIVAAGIDTDGLIHVIEDATIARATPAAWAARAIALYHHHAADALVVEVNQGGEMATAVLHQCDPAVPVTPVRAKLSLAEHFRPASFQQIGAFENACQAPLPRDYVEFLRVGAFAAPLERFFDVVEARNMEATEVALETVQCFLGFDMPAPVCNLDYVLQLYAGRVPQGVVPIAGNGAGDYICFDLRGGDTARLAPVVLWRISHFWEAGEWREQDLLPVAGSFTGFRARLRAAPRKNQQAMTPAESGAVLASRVGPQLFRRWSA